MIFGYFDESGEAGDGHFVIAGFVGKRKDWNNFLHLWKEAKEGYGHLHLKEMRLAAPNAPRRHGKLLERLGAIPHKANLKPFAGSVRPSDYVSQIKGTTAEIVMAGYSVALASLIDTVLESNQISKRDRIEFTFEYQAEFNQVRTLMFKKLRKVGRYTAHHGLSRIAKDSSQMKDVLLEASDYLSYAVLQQLVDPRSQKSKLTEPILRPYRVEHTEVTKENYSQLVESLFGNDLAQIPTMSKDQKKHILRKPNEVLFGLINK